MHDDRNAGDVSDIRNMPAGADAITRLAGMVSRLARTDPRRLAAHLADLSAREQAELALRLPAKARLELLLHAPKPMRLVRSLPDADFYATAREVGPTDALGLLALGSFDQLLHVIDLESWRGDRFDPERSGAWVAVFLESGEPTLRRFLRHTDDDLLTLLVQRWLRVSQIEIEDDPSIHGSGHSETGDERGFVSPDGYHRISPAVAEHGPAVGRLLQLFFEDQPARYNRVFWSALWELPSEVEEKALRWRQSRLEEHGFPAWDEALSVYAPPERDATHIDPPPEEEGRIPVPRTPLRAFDGPQPLALAIDGLAGEARERTLHEFVSLANHLLIADGADTGDPLEHRGALIKAAGYVGIALHARGARDDSARRAALEEVPMVELFREGYARAVELQRRARRLRETGWAAAHEDALQMLDPPIDARVARLGDPRPRYVAVTDDGDYLVRDFQSFEEIAETLTDLRIAEVVGDLFVRLGVSPGALRDRDGDPVRFSTLLLTALAWHTVRGAADVDPLPPEVVGEFLRRVASRRTADPDAPGRALENLLRHLSERRMLDARSAALLHAYGRACLERLAADCSALDPGAPVDPRFVSSLRIA